MFKNFDKDRVAAYVQVVLLALAATTIYSAPYLRQLFKTSMLDAFQLTEIQLGNLSTTYASARSSVISPAGGWPTESHRVH
jgi:hypothetical protein